jgi:branched-chain amino acid transport system permease protein
MTREKRNRLRNASLIVLIILFMVLPHFLSPYLLHIMIMTFLYAYLSRNWDLIGGYAGQLFLGPAAMFGIGGYTSSLLYVHLGLTPWIGMWIGGFLGMVVGVLLCYVSFRCGLKGIYFGLATLAFAEICKVIAVNVDFLGGVNGILLPVKGSSFLAFQFDSKIPYYYISFFMMLLSIYVMYRIERSKSGFYYVAIRENEEAAESLGVNTLKYKLISTGIGCFFLSVGGTFHAQYLMFVNPDTFFGLAFTTEVIIRSIVGGVGTLLGPILGSFILTPLSDLSRAVLGGYRGVHLMVFGIIIILIVLFLPNGVGRWFGKYWERAEIGSRKEDESTENR